MFFLSLSSSSSFLSSSESSSLSAFFLLTFSSGFTCFLSTFTPSSDFDAFFGSSDLVSSIFTSAGFSFLSSLAALGDSFPAAGASLETKKNIFL